MEQEPGQEKPKRIIYGDGYELPEEIKGEVVVKDAPPDLYQPLLNDES